MQHATYKEVENKVVLESLGKLVICYLLTVYVKC